MSYQVEIPIAVVHNGVIHHAGVITLEKEEDAELIAKAAGIGLEEIIETEDGKPVNSEDDNESREEELRKLPVATLREMAKEHGISPSQSKAKLAEALAAEGV